jgi:hypothetical protein
MLETKAYFKHIKQDLISLDVKMNWPVTRVLLLTTKLHGVVILDLASQKISGIL